MSTQLHPGELAALRKLEQAVRACGLPTMMVSGQVQLEMLAEALREIARARDDAREAGVETAL
ncbi:MAG TPA: hypothetical protein VEB70_05285 [Noviherbaspirillum sp.]|nr:hypothetical protein [Noviherbaspirillum sp.]